MFGLSVYPYCCLNFLFPCKCEFPGKFRSYMYSATACFWSFFFGQRPLILCDSLGQPGPTHGWTRQMNVPESVCTQWPMGPTKKTVPEQWPKAHWTTQKTLIRLNFQVKLFNLICHLWG